MADDDHFVDGGAALVRRPYDDAEWAAVRTAWWWHTIGMFVFQPWYSLIALTVWQQPSRQSLARRFIWSLLLTIGAMCLVGLPAAIVFSRRWYWMYRTNTDPDDVGVGESEPDASSGYLAWIAVGGGALADRLTNQRTRPPLTAPPSLGEPWASLLGDAAHAVARIERAVDASSGPATARMVDALREATASVAAAHRVAVQASGVERALGGMGIERAEERLRTLESSPETPDVVATKESLSEQLATAGRMRAHLAKLEGQLQRLVAQLGEAAARADELALCPPGELELAPGMGRAVDDLAAIRSALEAVEQPPR